MGKDNKLFSVIKKFLDVRLEPDRPVLLGCSGGPDSKALLYLLVAYRRLVPFELHVAHLDHGWREESREEALQLQEEVEELGLRFHLKTLKRSDFQSKNWENQGREQRLRFFSELYEAINAQCLMIGHHADDWAEVVLKRLFEGASIPSLGGLSEQSSLRGMVLYRPLLSVSKAELLQWLSDRQLSYFRDPTNESSAFLRGRMRLEMIPFLRRSFGKEISGNLCRLGEEAQELRGYFSELNRPLLELISSDQKLDLNPHLPLPKLQLRYLLKEWIDAQGMFLSREMLDAAVETVIQLGAFAKFQSKRGVIEIKRGVVYLIR